MICSLRLILVVLLFSVVSFSGCAGGDDPGLLSPVDGDAAVDGDSTEDAEGTESADGDGLEDPTDGDESPVDGDEEATDKDREDDPTDGDEEEVERITLDLVEGCNPLATSDECVFPYPSMFFEVPDADSPTGVRGNYPEDALPNKEGDTYFDVSSANAADGCSPAVPILLHFAADVSEDYITTIHELDESLDPESPIALFDMETGERVMFMTEMDMNRKSTYEDRYAFIIRPLEPMRMGARHVLAIKSGIADTEGNEFDVPETFLALRDGVLTTNDEVEDMREHYGEIFSFLAGKGYATADLYLAWSFQVASEEYLLGSVLSMRETALEIAGTDALGYRIEEIQEDINENVAKMVFGQFEVPTYIDENHNFDYDENHHPVRRAENMEFPFTMVIPQKAKDGEPLPLIMFGHGIFGDGRSYMTSSWAGERVVQPLAQQQGAVILATDWIGLSSGDLDIIIAEVIPDLNRLTLVTDRLQQSLINNLTLTELALGPLQQDEQIRIGEHTLIDSERIYYYGVSLGGIQGSSYVSLSNHISRGILAVPGCVWSNMLPRSIVWSTIKFFFDAEYPDPLVQQLGIGFMQSYFDHSDPVNITRLMFFDPLPDAPADRNVVVQEAIGDSQVPNLTTEMLGRAAGLKLVTPSIYEVPALDTVAAPTYDAGIVQYHLVDQLTEENIPPESNVPPAEENGVHADMVFLPQALEQVTHFLETGEIANFCEGPCDPD